MTKGIFVKGKIRILWLEKEGCNYPQAHRINRLLGETPAILKPDCPSLLNADISGPAEGICDVRIEATLAISLLYWSLTLTMMSASNSPLSTSTS